MIGLSWILVSYLRRQTLLRDTSSDELTELQEAVTQAVTAAEGDGWSVMLGGGAARGRSTHDVDFIITCEGSTR